MNTEPKQLNTSDQENLDQAIKDISSIQNEQEKIKQMLDLFTRMNLIDRFQLIKPLVLKNTNIQFQNIFGGNGTLAIGSDGNIYWKNSAGISIPLSSAVEGVSHGSSVTSISSGSTTKLTPSTNDSANGITWDGSNHQFTVVISGYYLVTAQVTYSATVASYPFNINIVAGSDGVTSYGTAPSTNSYTSISGSKVVYLNAGDTVYIQTTQYSGMSQTVLTGADQTFLSINKV